MHLKLTVPILVLSKVFFSQTLEEPAPPPSLPNGSIADAKAAGMRSPEEIQFWRAITNRSTATSFVVVTLVRSTGNNVYCTEAPFLLAAIHAEYNIPFTAKGQSRAIEIALRDRANGFKFTNKRAIKNIPLTYGASEFDWVDQKLSTFSNDQIVQLYKSRFTEPFEESLLKGAPKTKGNYRHALAHVIYSKGLCVGRGCVNSSLWVSE